jgi:hypothetical protein
MLSIVLLLVVVISLGVLLAQVYYERVHLQRRFNAGNSLISREERERQLDESILAKQNHLNALRREQASLSLQLNELKQQIRNIEEEVYIQSFGFYEPKYDFVSAGDYESELKDIKAKQKSMIRDGRAAICTKPLFFIENEKDSQRKIEQDGRKVTESFLKLMLKIFNSECDDIISKVKHNNIESSKERINRSFNNLNKTSERIKCKITDEYRDSKFKELELQYGLECAKQIEKEDAQASEQDKREQQKLEKELKKLEEAEEREQRFQQALDNALREKEAAFGKRNEKLEFDIQQLRQELAQAKSDREKANDAVESIKEGYIYVISNIRSFGRRDIYRICMTKSRDPDTYVSIMNRTVPFPFDVHIKFLSEDISDTLSRLHQRFHDRRVNKANERREFFRASLDEIHKAVEEIRNETGALKNIWFEKAPQDYEYPRTLAFDRKESSISDNETA